MEESRDSTRFNPERTPFTTPEAQYTYVELPLGLLVKVNSDTLRVEKIEEKEYPGMPHRLPPALMAVEQPHIKTCGPPGPNNRGCDAAVNGGCPILRQYGRVGPVNIIIEKNGKVDSAPCHTVYCGITNSGRPASQVHYLMDGWRILTDRTKIPENVRDPATKAWSVRYTEVPELAPFYEEFKVGRFSENGKPEPKKIGRPKGSKNKARETNADREDRPAAQV